MKFRILVIAVASSIANLALAQSSTVTLYGRLNPGIQWADTGVAKTTRLSDGAASTSMWGLRGTEDLGGGVSAFFHLESKIAVDSGNSGSAANSGALIGQPGTAFFGRYSYVGLEGSLGKVTLGRDMTPVVLALTNFNALPSGINTGLATNVAPQGIGNDFWNSNQIRYESRNLNGFSFQTNYSFGEVADSISRGATLGGALFYKSSGLTVTAAAQQNNDVGTSGKNLKWGVLTASYSTGNLKVAVGYDKVNNPDRIATGPANSGWVDSSLWTVGAAYKFLTNLTIGTQYYNVEDAASGSTSKQLVVDMNYQLSKRTSLYGLVTHTSNGAIPLMLIYGSPGTARAVGKGYDLGIITRF